MIRPEAARWFEVLVARDDAFVALEALAATGAVEIEWRQVAPSPDASSRINPLLKQYGALSRRYRAYWPAPRLRATTRIAPADALAGALGQINAWAVDAGPVIASLQAAESMLAELDAVARLMERLQGAPIDLSKLAVAGAGVRVAAFVYAKGARLPLPSSLLLHPVDIGEDTYLLAVGAQDAVESLAQEVAAANGRRVRIPEWLAPSADENLVRIADERTTRAAEAAELRATLRAVHERHALAIALGDVARAAWCFENGGAVERGEMFSRITGWTSAPASLVRAIEGANARALASLPPPPRGVRPPLLLRNPWWAQPFEVFSRLFGMPGEYGADPSAVLAIAVPLLFGYMFGDVGQGLVLVALGVALRRRVPVARLLVPAGLSATVFGLLFGSVFSLEGLIQPLWLHPLADPLTVLVVPLAGGALLLTLGLALSALEAYWAGRLGEWLVTDAGFLLVYVGILGALAHPAGLLVALAGAVLFAGGRAALAGESGAALTALGELLERGMQILINTLSFARVGAFALAHAGLSSAVVALAEAAGGSAGHLAVLAIGNVVVIALEGLVVSIQTTRLILFEFFARFFRAEGREFRPLLPPPVATEER
jgi:V/A-type H+-transporting ATPase subunit I